MEEQNISPVPGPESDSRIVHYAFAYQMLPMLIFSKHNEAIWDQFRDPDSRQSTLEEAWMRTCRHFDVKDFAPNGLQADFLADEHKEYLVIHMPTPAKPPEAYCCVAQKSLKEPRYRYFSSEYGFVPDGGHSIVLGEWLAPMHRRNLGELPSADANELLTAIAALGVTNPS